MTTSRKNPDGSIDINTDSIRRIDLKDITTVARLTNVTEGNLTTIEIDFDDGGTVFIQFTDKGVVHDFRGDMVCFDVSDNKIVTISKMPNKTREATE